MIRAVVFDLDGVLMDSEHLWDEARRKVAADQGGTWHPGATLVMQGMSSIEWSRYMHNELGVRVPPSHIVDLVLEQLFARYEDGVPLLPGAAAAVDRLAAHWPLAVASSANRVVIEHVLDVSGLSRYFAALVSSEEVARGKPDPDVYLEAALRIGEATTSCAAVEDAANGIRAAVAAGMRVVAMPNPRFPPPRDVVAEAALVIDSLDELTVEAVELLSP